MKKLFNVEIIKAYEDQPKYGYGKRTQAITVTRGGKVFQRQQQVGRKQQQLQQQIQSKVKQFEPAQKVMAAAGMGKQGSFAMNLVNSLAQNSDILTAGTIGMDLMRSVSKNKGLKKEEAKDIFAKYSKDLSEIATNLASKGSKKLTGQELGEDEKELVSSVGHKLINMTLNKPQKLRDKFWLKALQMVGKDPKEEFKKWQKQGIIDAFSNYTAKKALKTMLESKELAAMYGGRARMKYVNNAVNSGKYGNLSKGEYNRYANQTKQLSKLISIVGKKQFIEKHAKPGMMKNFMGAIDNVQMGALYLKNLRFAGKETESILNDVGIKIPKSVAFAAKKMLVPLAKKGISAAQGKITEFKGSPTGQKIGQQIGNVKQAVGQKIGNMASKLKGDPNNPYIFRTGK
jgi:hypothetical protein